MTQKGTDPQETGQLEGRYANYFKVGHNAFEFLLDFGQVDPESETARIHTRIVVNPIYAKVLLETLLESVRRYEETFGLIAEKDAWSTRQATGREASVPLNDEGPR